MNIEISIGNDKESAVVSCAPFRPMPAEKEHPETLGLLAVLIKEMVR